MLNWIVLNRNDYLHKMDLALNNLQELICHKTQQTKANQPGIEPWSPEPLSNTLSTNPVAQLWILLSRSDHPVW